MNVVSAMDTATNILCVVILATSVVPFCMMPIRVFQAYCDEVRSELDRDEETDNPMYAWIVYGLVITGVLFSICQLGLVNENHAFAVASIVGFVLACLWLASALAAAIYIKIAKWWRKAKRKSAAENE